MGDLEKLILQRLLQRQYTNQWPYARAKMGTSALPTLLGEPRSDLPYPPHPVPASIAFSYPRICTGKYYKSCSDDAARTLMRLHLSPYLCEIPNPIPAIMTPTALPCPAVLPCPLTAAQLPCPIPYLPRV